MKAINRAKRAMEAAFPGTRVIRRIWLQRPDEWFLRGVYLGASTYGDDSVSLNPLLMPLFVPSETVSFILEHALEAPLWTPGHEPDSRTSPSS